MSYSGNSESNELDSKICLFSKITTDISSNGIVREASSKGSYTSRRFLTDNLQGLLICKIRQPIFSLPLFMPILFHHRQRQPGFFFDFGNTSQRIHLIFFDTINNV